jgi:UDP-2,3-diacylglucosamine pyrophosphatase LpxH
VRTQGDRPGRISWPGLRTLVISDLHLGNRARHDVLRRPAPLARLLEALDDVDRLVLLGDLAELITRSPRRSLAAAEPVLRALGTRMGSGREVILVPGNHDAPLIRAWARAQGAQLGIADTVDPNVTRALARVVSWLGPSRVRVHYPGVWLTERIWATHGHYLDHHLIPQSPIGLPRGPLAHRPARAALALEYERGRIRSHHSRDALLTRALQRPLTTLAELAAELARAAMLPHVPRMLMRARLAPVTAAIIDVQMRHAALSALARVLARLGVQADWVVFGHVHRLGPLSSDRQTHWRAGDDGPRLLNSGSWLYDPLLVDRARAPHPYWPGGAVLIESGSEPRAVGLLDDLAPGDLRGGPGAGAP